MEKLQHPRLPERARNGETRSLRGCGARPVSSAASKMGDYAEIFGGFALSCSIPVLVLPEAMEGYGEELVESRSLNYAEIFGDHDSGSFSLCYEELLSMDNGINENDRRFQEQINGGQVVTGASLMHSAVPIGDLNIFSKMNQTSSSLDLNLDTKQLNFFVKTSQQSTEDEVKSTKDEVKSTEGEVKSTIGSSVPQSYNEPYFEDETFYSTRFVEVATPKEFASDDHVLHGYIEEREDGKQRETFNRCFVSATVDHSEKDPKPLKHSTPEGNAENLKQHSRSSSYHSASSGDVPFSDYSFLSISDINLNTQPLQVPPPSRAPPKYNMKQESSKSESLKSSDTTSDIELIPEPYKSYHAPNIGGPRTRHALKETMKTNSPVYLNVEVDASSAAAASAAAMIEAMEQAQASLKNAKELMERKGVRPQSERRKDPHDFGVCNGQSVNFSRRSRHKTKAKVVPKLVERVNSVFSEDPGEPMHGKESRFNLLWNEKERSHEWKIDKQFYELVSNERLMGSKIINDDKYNSNEATKLARQLNSYQFFPEKKVCGKERKMFSQSNIESEKQNQYRISEKTLYTGGELQLQDGNSKKSKFGSTIDDEDKQKVGPVHQVCNDAKLKVEDTIIQLDMKGSKLKECQDSHTSVENKKSEDDIKESKANGRNDSSFIDGDNKHEEFSGEPVGKILGKSKECDGIHGISLVSEFVPLSTYEMGMCNSTVTSDVTVNKKFEAKLSSLENANEVEVGTEYRTSFSIENVTNLEDLREKRQPGMLKKTRKTSVVSYGEGKNSELEYINDTFEKDISGSLIDTDKTIDEKKRKYEIRDKLNMPNRCEVKVSNLFVQPDFFENAKALNYQQNVDEKNVYELPQKFENYVDMLIADGEGREGEKHHVGKVQAAVVLENKIKGLSAGHHLVQRNRGQDYEAAYLANTLDKKSNILSPSVDASGSSLKQMDKHIHDESKDANYIRKEVSDRERMEVVQKSMLEEERAREREKDKIAVEITCGESCDKVFAEVRERSEKIVFEKVAADSQNKPIAEHRDITEKSSAKAFEKSEKIANEAKLRAERAAVERATAEARERALERALAKQASLESKTQAENLGTVSKDKTWKTDASENIVCPVGKVTDISPKINSNVYDTSIHIKSQSAAGEGESPLRCKARQERNQRIVERAANALAEKNVRDLIAQREQAERNRLAESLDAEVRRWSTGKEGNLRALLSTLQYILGQDSGWQPIPLAAVITAAGVRKAYRKATLYVHPDKLQQRGASIQHKYICEKIFDLLKDAWNRFDS